MKMEAEETEKDREVLEADTSRTICVRSPIDFNDVSLHILSVQLKDKVKRLSDKGTVLPETTDFVCDCGKPLRDSLFFPCVLQRYLATMVETKVIGGLINIFLNDYPIGKSEPLAITDGSDAAAELCEEKREKVVKEKLNGEGRARVGGARRRRRASIARSSRAATRLRELPSASLQQRRRDAALAHLRRRALADRASQTNPAAHTYTYQNKLSIQTNRLDYRSDIQIEDDDFDRIEITTEITKNCSTESSDDESKELEEFERQERWASNEEYFNANADFFAGSACQFNASDLVNYPKERPDDRLQCYDEYLEEEREPSAMRGDQPKPEDNRHNKDMSKLKSSIKKMPKTKCKKNRVTFNENKNEFFEADYIILIREECQYDEESDEGICTCSQHEMVRLPCCENDCNALERIPGAPQQPEFAEQVTLSPPEGYKDSGLFNQDGTFKDQSFFAREGPGLLVSEASGAVFTPQHLRQLQVIQRLQREQLRRARASLTVEAEEGGVRVEEQQAELTTATAEEKTKGFYAKEIVAGEERPKVNSGQQTTPTDDEAQLYGADALSARSQDGRLVREMSTNSNNEEPDSQSERHEPSQIDSPLRLGGILKGGRLWKSVEVAMKSDSPQQGDTEESGNFSNPASDEEGRAGRAVRFSEPPLRDSYDSATDPGSEDTPKSLSLTFRLGNHLLSNNSLRPNSAVRQLFPQGPHLVTPPQRAEDEKRYLVTTESLRAFEEAKRTKLPSSYRDEDLTMRRTIDRNTLRRSLVKIDPRKKIPIKNDTSLSERIKMLTCDLEEEEAGAEQETETERISPSNEEPRTTVPPSAKSFSPSSSSSASSCSSTSSTYKKLTEIFPKRQECISECNEEGSNVIIIPQNEKNNGDQANNARQYHSKVISCGNRQGDRLSMTSNNTEFSLTDLEASLEMPAPDVLAGTPGAGDNDELVRFVQQDAARTERLRRRYQPSEENSDEDDQDDYGFQRRPSVRGIKPRFGSTNEILQQMQAQLQMGNTTATTRPGHVSWPYYSESNLTQPAQHDHALHNPEGMHNSRASTEDFQQSVKMGSSVELSNQMSRDCYDLRNHNVPEHHQQHMEHLEHMQHMQHMQHKRIHDDSIYQNCVTYANIRCSVGERDLYSSQSSLVPVGSMTHMGPAYDNQSRNHRRPESPPPIRSYHQTMVLIPYSNLHQPHYSNTIDRNYSHSHAMNAEQNGVHPGYQHQSVNDQGTLLKINQNTQQIVGIPFTQPGVPMQITCSAPAAHIRTIPSRPVARHMICYSEKVEAPMYQAAPGSPVAVRGAPEGAPAPAASPTAPHPYSPHNSLYYAMNV